jgi:hypothetical protein
MKKLSLLLMFAIALSACQMKTLPDTTKDTLHYAYKASYSSDITVPGNPVNAQKVLQDASGMHFYGPTEKLLAYAKSDIDGLDSMRFDIVMWQSAHINDKDEDWVNIWARERRYQKGGKKADTVLMQENWKVKNGKVVAFDEYLAKK